MKNGNMRAVKLIMMRTMHGSVNKFQLKWGTHSCQFRFLRNSLNNKMEQIFITEEWEDEVDNWKYLYEPVLWEI